MLLWNIWIKVGVRIIESFPIPCILISLTQFLYFSPRSVPVLNLVFTYPITSNRSDKIELVLFITCLTNNIFGWNFVLSIWERKERLFHKRGETEWHRTHVRTNEAFSLAIRECLGVTHEREVFATRASSRRCTLKKKKNGMETMRYPGLYTWF